MSGYPPGTNPYGGYQPPPPPPVGYGAPPPPMPGLGQPMLPAQPPPPMGAPPPPPPPPMGGPPPDMPAMPPAPAVDVRSRFDGFCVKYEIHPSVAQRLWQVFFQNTKIVLLCDDSGSMNATVMDENSDPFAATLTRWQELKQLVVRLIEFGLAVGVTLDIYFLNRPALLNVSTMDGLQQVFAVRPSGCTPLAEMLNRIYQDTRTLPEEYQLLVLVMTDGEPTTRDGRPDRQGFYNALVNKRSNVHVSVAALTDNEEGTSFLILVLICYL